MHQLGRAIGRYLKHGGGPTAVEYAFMAFLILTICFIAIPALGQNTNGLYRNNATRITIGS